MNFDSVFHPNGRGNSHYLFTNLERSTALNKRAKIKSALIIDADDHDIFVIKQFLMIKNVTKSAIGRNTSNEAIDYLKGCRRFPDLIIIDLVKESMELIRFLNAFTDLEDPRKENTKIIIMSAYLEYYISNVQMALTFKNVVGPHPKPVNEDSLSEIIESIDQKKANPFPLPGQTLLI